MSVSEVLRIVGESVSILIFFVGFIVTLITAIKKARETKNWNVVETELQGYITKAESFTNFTGTEKKEIVLAWTSNLCSMMGIKFDVKKVSSKIEELLSLTKNVNQREKDKNQTVEISTSEPTVTIEEKKEGE